MCDFTHMGLNQRKQPLGSNFSKFLFGEKFVETHLLKDLSQEKVQYSDSKRVYTPLYKVYSKLVQCMYTLYVYNKYSAF